MRVPSPFRWLASIGAAVLLAACATTATRPAPAPPLAPATRPAPAPVACTTCGRIERIDPAPQSTNARPRGAVLGGVVGGVLAGPAPTATGAAKAAPAASRNARIVVLLDNGRRLILTQPLSAGMKPGARVRVDRSRVVLLR